ncbi:unnamed protein product [Lampetra planeri]
MPLAFHSALLALAKAAFPRMDHDGIDALDLERLLSLAKDLNTILPAVDDDDLSSLKVTKCIQAPQLLQRHRGLVACTVRSRLHLKKQSLFQPAHRPRVKAGEGTVWCDGRTNSDGQRHRLIPEAVTSSATAAACQGTSCQAAMYHDDASLEHCHHSLPCTFRRVVTRSTLIP